jgi:hypothetical protein
MPYKPAWPCIVPGCLNTTTSPTRHCDKHAHLYKPYIRPSDNRPSAATRGYDKAWRRIRDSVLREAGIPKADWPLYDVHHTPDYDPAIEPDHRQYTLTPLLHTEHARETNKRHRGGRVNPCGNFAETVHVMQTFPRAKFEGSRERIKNASR